MRGRGLKEVGRVKMNKTCFRFMEDMDGGERNHGVCKIERGVGLMVFLNREQCSG